MSCYWTWGIGRWHAFSFAQNGYDVFYIDPHVCASEYKRLEHVTEFHGSTIIIATTTKHRWSYVRQIEATKRGATVILEKPLFFTSREYSDFASLVPRNKYRVNLGFEESITRILKANTNAIPRRIRVHGSRWGLGCNILHDISMLGGFVNEFGRFKYFGDEKLSLVPSKRAGYQEVVGQLHFKIGDTEFSICDSGKAEQKKLTEIYFNDKVFFLDLYESKVESFFENVSCVWDFDVPRASVDSYRLFSGECLPFASKYSDIAFDLYSRLAETLGLDDEFPFT